MKINFQSYYDFIKVLSKQTLDDLARSWSVLGRDIDITYELSVATHNGSLAQAVSNIQNLLRNKNAAERQDIRDRVSKEFKKALNAVHARARLRLKGK